MSEKEMFLNAWEREFGITQRVLRNFPANKADYKPPSDKARSAKALAEVFISEMGVVDGVMKGSIDFGAEKPTYPTFPEVLTAYEKTYRSMVPKVKSMSEADWNSTMPFPVGAKQMAQLRKADILWFVLMDSVHHRGQFSIYLRMVGAKVPSIYGPSADEPWT